MPTLLDVSFIRTMLLTISAVPTRRPVRSKSVAIPTPQPSPPQVVVEVTVVVVVVVVSVAVFGAPGALAGFASKQPETQRNAVTTPVANCLTLYPRADLRRPTN